MPAIIRNRWILGLAAMAAIIVALFLTLSPFANEPPADNLVAALNQARMANAAHDLDRERLVLLHAEKLDGDAADAADIQRRLAVLDWKYHQRFEAARARLQSATQGGESAEAWLALARMEQAQRDFPAARQAATQALESAEKPSIHRLARLAQAQASVAQAVALRREGDKGATEFLAAAFAELNQMVQQESGLLLPSQLLLQSALLVDDGEAAWLAWRSYYHVPDEGVAPNAVAEAGGRLQRALTEGALKDADDARRARLAQALADNRFFDEAELVMQDPRAGQRVQEDQDLKAVRLYARAVREIRRATDEHYRLTSIGEGDTSAFRRQIRELASPVMEALGKSEPGTPASLEKIGEVFSAHFGAYISGGRTAGYDDMHYGHRIIDETRSVEHYGHRAELRFVSLDHMVSNGFQSWAWESGAEHGGWAGPDTIWQVRSAYANGPLDTWRAIHDPDLTAEFMQEMKRESELDEERARKDTYAYLPGLRMRLKKQGLEALMSRLEERGLESEALRLAFVAELERVQQESSIFAHEGRHAIDKRGAGKSSATWHKEFTAKLSEVAFAPQPRLAQSAIINANIGDDTPHGKANLKVMKGIVKWMKKHREEIDGLDPQRPLLAQYDRLTDEQIREAYRAMDPLAEER